MQNHNSPPVCNSSAYLFSFLQKDFKEFLRRIFLGMQSG